MSLASGGTSSKVLSVRGKMDVHLRAHPFEQTLEIVGRARPVLVVGGADFGEQDGRLRRVLAFLAFLERRGQRQGRVPSEDDTWAGGGLGNSSGGGAGGFGLGQRGVHGGEKEGRGGGPRETCEERGSHGVGKVTRKTFTAPGEPGQLVPCQ